MAFGCEPNGACGPLWIILEQFGVMARHHAAAGARGHNNVIAGFKSRHYLSRQTLRVAAVAGIEGRLPAAGLFRHHHFAARLFKQARSRKTNAGTKEINKAGGEKADARLGLGQCSILHD